MLHKNKTTPREEALRKKSSHPFSNSSITCKPIYLPKSFAPKRIVIRNNTRKIKNNTLAILAAPAAIPVNPNRAAMIAIMKKVIDHLSIIKNFMKINK